MVMVTILHSIKYTFGLVVDCAQWIEHLKWPHSDISIDFWCFITVVDVIWILVVDMLIFYPANTVKHKSTSVKVKVFFVKNVKNIHCLQCDASAVPNTKQKHFIQDIEWKWKWIITLQCLFVCLSTQTLSFSPCLMAPDKSKPAQVSLVEHWFIL